MFYIYIAIIIILLLLGLYLFINNLCNLVVYPNVKSFERTYETEVVNRGLENFINSIPTENIKLKSTLGYDLNCRFMKNGNSDKCIVLCHGITANLNCSIKYAKLFYDKGFSIFIYDHRNHGSSGGNFSSMGYFEKMDLKTCVDWVYSQFTHKIKLGVFGESMGAATVLQFCALDNRIDFCIEDCGYSSVNDLLKVRLREKFKIAIPGVLFLANALTKFKYKWGYEDASPINYMDSLSLPILFIHGGCDTYVPTNMVHELYNAKINGLKDIYICENAAHAISLVTDSSQYDIALSSFLKKIDLL